MYNLSHRINDNSENLICLNESIFIPKETIKVYTHAPYYGVERYLVSFDTYYFSGAFLIELEEDESLNITYGNYINQDLRLRFVGYGTYTDNDIEVQTYRFKIDNREITKNTLLEKQNNGQQNDNYNTVELKTQENEQSEIIDTLNEQKAQREIINLSLLGGLSLQAKPIIDCNIKIYCLTNMFIVLQGGGTAIDKISNKITSAIMITESSLGIGVSIQPFESYKLNLFGYGSIGFSFLKLNGGYVKDGKYKDSVFYPMFRACVGIDFPITKSMCVSLQDCFDYLVDLGFNDHISAGLTLKF